MLPNPDQILQILSAGGGMSLDRGMYAPEQLAQFAAAAACGGGTLTLRDCRHLSPQHLVKIGAAGRGHVVFEFK